MNRLTKRTICGTANLAYPESCYFKSGAKDQIAVSAYRQQAIERLAEYEDTGLEPEKIVFLKNVVDDAFSDKPEFTEHIRELLRAEKDGRLVVLPCRVGDRIYRVIDDCTFPGIVERKGCVKGANIEICLSNKLHSVCIYLLMTGSYGEVTTAPVKKPKRHWRVTKIIRKFRKERVR